MNKHILYLGLVFSIVFLAVYALGLHNIAEAQMLSGNQFWFRNQAGYQLLTLGWYVSTFLVGALAVMMGAGSISREIESGTILSLASRPFSRSDILMGKFMAYSMVTALYSGIMAAAITTLASHYFQLMINPRAMITGILIFMLFPMVLLAIAHLASVITTTLTAGIVSFMLFIIAITGGFMEQIGAVLGNRSLVNTGVVASLIMPCDAIYRMAVKKAVGMLGTGYITDFGPFGVASAPSIWMLVYALAYTFIIIFLAMHYFNKRDL